MMNNKVYLDMWNNAHVDSEGVVRWIGTNNIPSEDILEAWRDCDLDFNFDKTVRTRHEENEEFLSNYRKRMQNYRPSEEELYELRAEFGEGQTIVNIITGQKISL